MSNCYKFCQKLKDFWKAKEIKKIMDLFSKNVIYFEEPNNQITYQELLNVWSEIKNQNTTNIEFKILVENASSCIANFILKDQTTIDMIYEIKLDKENKCIYFKQWYMEY